MRLDVYKRQAYANVKGEQANHLMRKIPYTIIPGEEGKLRKDIFLERAIVEELSLIHIWMHSSRHLFAGKQAKQKETGKRPSLKENFGKII